MPAYSFNIEVIAIGKLKKTSPYYSAFTEYQKRLKSKFKVIELNGHNQSVELAQILNNINPSSALFCLDEKGKTLSSLDFAKHLEIAQINKGAIQFIIGGADGVDDRIRQKADHIISFGKQTWPHMMVRVMLLEQVYRAQQILANHPYHRE